MLKARCLRPTVTSDWTVVLADEVGRQCVRIGRGETRVEALADAQMGVLITQLQLDALQEQDSKVLKPRQKRGRKEPRA